MDQDTLHIKHTTYQILHVTCARNSNESKHMTYTIAHIVDGFGQSASIFEGSMNEYRHMTYSIHFRLWIHFLQMALHNTAYVPAFCKLP